MRWDMRKLRYLLIVGGLLMLGPTSSRAAILFNEYLVNAPGADDGREFVELVSDSGGAESVDGLTVIQVDGDGASAGKIDRIHTFGPGDATGSNGLLLFRDSADVLLPAPDVDSTVIVEADPQTFFDTDLENGSSTLFLVSGFSGAIGDDLDSDNDGVFDDPGALPWAAVHDAVGWAESDPTPDDEHAYAAAVGGLQVIGFDIGFTPDAFVRSDGGFFAGLDGPDMGPFVAAAGEFVNAAGASLTPPAGFSLTPGGVNPAAVPEPSSFALLGVLLLAVGVLRKKLK